MPPTTRQLQAQKVITAYSSARKSLSKDEQPFFDKAVSLIEELSDVEGSPKLAALDISLVVALMAIKANRTALSFMIHALTSIVVQLASWSIIGGASGSRNSD